MVRNEAVKQAQLQIGPDTIAVYESRGSGAAVLLIHGNSANAEMFAHQFAGDFGASYRVVALDLPGHGRSSSAADPEGTYCLSGYASIVVNVVKHLGLARPVVVGWSLGGHIALEAAEHLPDAAGFFIYGAPPFGIPPAMDQAYLPNPNFAAAFSQAISREQASIVAKTLVRPGADPPQEFREAILNTDGRARLLLGASLYAMEYTDEIQIVTNMRTPLAIAHGAEDAFVNLNYLKNLEIPSLWRGEVQVIAGAGHASQWEQPDRFNALLSDFVDGVSHRKRN